MVISPRSHQSLSVTRYCKSDPRPYKDRGIVIKKTNKVRIRSPSPQTHVPSLFCSLQNNLLRRHLILFHACVRTDIFFSVVYAYYVVYYECNCMKISPPFASQIGPCLRVEWWLVISNSKSLILVESCTL